MRLARLVVFAFLLLAPTGVPAQAAHDFTFTSIEGEPLPLAEFRGTAVLVVNTASFRPIHRFNTTRRSFSHDQIARHFGRDPAAERPLEGVSVVDIGCGAGLLCEPLAEQGADILGIDAAARNLAIARHHAAENGMSVRYRHCPAENLLADRERFDVVLSTEVVEHVADQEAFIAKCSAQVKHGGLTIVATLNRTRRSFLLGIVTAEYLLGWLPKGTHDWRRLVTPVELERMLEAIGLRTRELVGVACNLFTRN